LSNEFKVELDKLAHEIRFVKPPAECQSLPLPGYVGKRYSKRGILFVGKNPGQPGKRHPDGYWAGEHHYDRSMRVDCLREHYFEGLRRCPVGIFLEELLRRNSLTMLDDIAYTNVVKCVTKNNMDPSAPLVEFWLPYLKKELYLLKPKLIVCLGQFAVRIFNSQASKFKTFRCELVEGVVLYLPHPSMRGIKRTELIKRSSESFRNGLKESGAI
jgi:hypothetical protein